MVVLVTGFHSNVDVIKPEIVSETSILTLEIQINQSNTSQKIHIFTYWPLW